eukprot:CAMPEP_0170075332 /NCGR_PEP_ID=MMETSP0019_2-20121128/12488_1 /TAXON_ID=98059 /ORGANISM="Dinobryon sp., Strain UTEXLB2267" /LENGTH=474 /DNA_ID=CAMNT_0010286233 /DNA_START=315 /DNA_END=1739 /DNA_ORIENTATION=-
MKAVVSRFQEVGDVTISKLETQLDLKDGVHVMIVYCMPDVFPVTGPISNERSMVLYVDRSFKDIFEFFKLESGWETIEEEGVKSSAEQSSNKPAQKGRCVEVRGPPGSGKYVDFLFTSFYVLLCVVRQINGCLCGVEILYLSTKHKKTVVYVPMKSVANEDHSTIAFLMEDFVISVTIPFGGNRNSILSYLVIELEPQCVFMDGMYHGMEKDTQMCKNFFQNSRKVRVEFLGATTSVIGGDRFFPKSKKFESSPWSITDYTAFIQHSFINQGFSLTKALMLNLGCGENSSMDEVIAAVERKYLMAGHSCSFMLDYSEDEIIDILTEACETVMPAAMTYSDRSNPLVVKRKITEADEVTPLLVPVSMAAAVLMHKHKLLEENKALLFLGTLEAAKVRHWPILGWHFEQDDIDRLKAYLTPVAVCPPTREEVSQEALNDLMRKLTLKKAATLEFVPPFELLIARTVTPFQLPQGGV